LIEKLRRYASFADAIALIGKSTLEAYDRAVK
jgi:hypothetical protein